MSLELKILLKVVQVSVSVLGRAVSSLGKMSDEMVVG